MSPVATDWQALIVPAAVGLVASMLLLATTMRLASPLGLLDHPRGHKAHAGATPLVGGLAIVLAWMVALAVPSAPVLHPALVSGVLMLLVVGLWDDLKSLSTTVRFAAQICACGAMIVLADVRLSDFGELLWPGRVLALGPLSLPMTVFAVVGVINALNMIDGMDGLAGTVALVALGSMAWLAGDAGRWGDAAGIALLIVVLLPFLALNARVGRARAIVFLGNGGSLAFGLVIGWYCVDLSQGPVRAMDPVTALWLLAVPLVDTVSVMLRRMARGKSPFTPGHDHVHHWLQALGLGVPVAWCVLAASAAVLALAGVLLDRYDVPDAVRYFGFLALAFAYHGIRMRSEAVRAT